MRIHDTLLTFFSKVTRHSLRERLITFKNVSDGAAKIFSWTSSHRHHDVTPATDRCDFDPKILFRCCPTRSFSETFLARTIGGACAASLQESEFETETRRLRHRTLMFDAHLRSHHPSPDGFAVGGHGIRLASPTKQLDSAPERRAAEPLRCLRRNAATKLRLLASLLLGISFPWLLQHRCFVLKASP